MSIADYIELEIARGRLQSIVDEAGAVLMRTAFSKVVRESKDFACALLSADGRTIAQSSQSVPVFLGTMSNTARAFLEHPLMAELKPGEVIATNDPWLGTGQLYDLTIAAPVHLDGEIVAFAAVVAHLSDIGGRGFVHDSKEMFEEGIRLPIHRIADAERIDPVIADFISANVRLPREVLGDISAMLNSSTVMATRLRALLDEISVPRFVELNQGLEARTDAYMRKAISELTPGTYRASMTSEGFAGTSFTVALTATVADDHITLDFEGSSPQVPLGINSAFSYTQSYAVYAIKCLLAPEMPFNDGVLKPVTVKAPEGSILNCTFPAAGTARSTTGHFIPSVIYEALAGCAPDRILAQSGAPRPTLHLDSVDRETGERSHALVVVAGGMGARAHRDGISCINFPTNTEWVPIEIVESSCPVLFEAKELVPDSGGAGRMRGGLGQRVTVRNFGTKAVASVQGQWLSRSPGGVQGGGDAGRAAVSVNGEPVAVITEPIPLQPGDALTLQSAGGGGFGPAAERDPDAVAADLRGGYVRAAQS